MMSLENLALTVMVLAALTALVCVVELAREAWTAARMSKPKYGYLVKKFSGEKLPLEILSSPYGWYIGTRKDGSPYTQESAELYSTAKAAERAFRTGRWTQRQLAIGGRAKKVAGLTLPVEIFSSRGGWYIGARLMQYRSRESVERYSTLEAADQAFKTGQWTQRPGPSWRVRRRLLYRRVRQIFAEYLRRGELWKEIINEGLWPGLMLFFLRWSFDVYLSLLSGQKATPVLKEKLSHFPSEFITEGYIYLVAGALLGSLVWTIVSEGWDAYVRYKAFHPVYHITNKFWYRVRDINWRIVDPLFSGLAAQIAAVYLVLAAFGRLDVWEKDYAAAVFGGVVFLKVLDNWF